MAEVDNAQDETHDDTRDDARTRRSQARGRERRERLLAAASQLLGEREIEEISLQDLARTAGIPTSSAYHFYTNAMDAFAALTEEIGAALAHTLTEPLELPPKACWEDVVTITAERAVTFYRTRPDARRLLIGSHTPPHLKRSDRDNDRTIAAVMRDHIDAAFQLPVMERDEDVYFHAIEIADLFYSLSMLRHGEITDEMAEEAVRAMVAYLRTYLPARLPRRHHAESERPTP